MITISSEDFSKRVRGCWLGKAVGGTLGMPYEGAEGPLDLKFYDPVPTGVIPNDDLDLQVLWAELIKRKGPFINRTDLAKCWRTHTDFQWDEYGSASANFARNIFPPMSGHHSNYCGDCLGSPIRSEIWGILAAGDPKLACQLAYEDAILDHDGEGIYGELFLAALESAAFITQDRDELIQIGLSVIPSECKISQSIRDTIKWYNETKDWRIVREKILEKFGKHNFTDVPQNMGFIILGWLAGKDFGEKICIAVNCGKDADCTGATLGAVLGLIDPDSISEEWKKPISEALALSPGMKNMNPPKTIDDFSSLTIKLADQMLNARSTKVRLGSATDISDLKSDNNIDFKLETFKFEDTFDSILLTDGPLKITAYYPDGLTFIPGETMPIRIGIENKTDDAIKFNSELLLPSDWSIANGKLGEQNIKAGETESISVTLNVPSNIRMYHEYTTLRLEASGIRSEYELPMVSAWQWQMKTSDQNEYKTTWLPERKLFPPLLTKPGEVFSAKTKFHCSRKQRVRVVLANNGKATLTIDGKKLIDDSCQHFMPMTHRAELETFCDVELELGLHELELTLEFETSEPKAALLFSDAGSTLLIHDITVATDITH